MSRLSDCIKKAGKNINKDDMRLIKENNQQYLDDGIPENEAGSRAVEDLVRLSHEKVTGYETEIEAKGGVTGSAGYNLDTIIAAAKRVFASSDDVSPLDKLIEKAKGPKAQEKEKILALQQKQEQISLASEEYRKNMVSHKVDGKVLRGVVVPEITLSKAQTLDPDTFKKGNGYFVREGFIDKIPEAGIAPTGVDLAAVGPDGRREYTAEEETAAREVLHDFDADGKSIRERVGSIIKNFKTKLRQRAVDQFASFKEILDNPKAWMQAHLASSAPGAVQGAIDHGQPFRNRDGVIRINTHKKSLKQILERLGENLERWTLWMAAHRAEKLKKQDREKLFSEKSIQVLKDINAADVELFESVRKEFEEMNNAIVQIGVDTGLIDAEEAQQWREEGFYLPFYRVLEEGEVQGPRAITNSGLVRQNAYRVLKGGKEKLPNLMANAVLNWNHLMSASLKNQASVAAVDAALRNGMATSVPKGTKNAIFVRRNGKESWYEISEPLVMESLVAMNWEGMNSRFMKIGRAFKRALTIGVTASPEFKIKNLLRDSIQALAVTTIDTNIAKNLYHGWQATEKGSEIQIQMAVGGGTFDQSGYIHGNDPEAARRLIEKGLSKEDVEASILNVPAQFKKIWKSYQDFGARLENLNRAADYAQQIADGVDTLTATFNARDHLDFTRMGTSTSVRWMAQLVPFLNARLQGIDKLARSAPGTLKEFIDPREASRFKTVVGMYSMVGISMYLAIKDDDDYKETEEWEKRTYHHFKLPGNETLFRIPRPFEVGAIAYLNESLVHQMVSDDVHGALFAERLGHTITDTFALNPIPQLIKPFAEVAMNKSFFTGRPLESEYDRILNKSPALRKRAWSSETSILLAEGFDKIPWERVKLSPIQIEHLVRGYLGWAGASILFGTDMLITRPLTDAPSRPPIKVTELPIARAFVKTMPAKNTEFTAQFYERLEDLNRVMADIRDAKTNDDLEKYIKLKTEQKDLLAIGKFLQNQRAQLSKINRRMKLIMGSDMDPVAKGHEVDRLTRAKNARTKMIADATKK